MKKKKNISTIFTMILLWTLFLFIIIRIYTWAFWCFLVLLRYFHHSKIAGTWAMLAFLYNQLVNNTKIDYWVNVQLIN